MEYAVHHRYVVEPEPEMPPVYPGFTRYSCRAETPVDVVRFLAPMYDRCREDQKQLGELTIIPYPNVSPDCKVEFVSNYSLQELREVMQTVEDGHVMVETFRPVPLMLNSLKRDSSFYI